MSTEKRCCPTDNAIPSTPYVPHGDQYYITGPLTSKKGILVISDIFGLADRSKRFLDILAKHGYLIVMPDFFGARAWDPNDFPPKGGFETPEWGVFYALIRDHDAHRPRARRAVAFMRQLGCTRISTLGMCWGARITFDLSNEGLVDAACTMHPSLFTPEMVRLAKTPVCVVMSKDEKPEGIEDALQALPHETVYHVASLLSHGFCGAHYEPEAWPPENVAQAEEATKMVLDFFAKQLTQ